MARSSRWTTIISRASRLLQQRMHVSDIDRRGNSRRKCRCSTSFSTCFTTTGNPCRQPWSVRRAALEQLKLDDTAWQVSPAVVGNGDRVWATAKQHALEGVIAKKLDSTYLLGGRSSDWLKIKLVLRQEFVVGGWTEGRDAPDQLGSILIGYYDIAKKPGEAPISRAAWERASLQRPAANCSSNSVG